MLYVFCASVNMFSTFFKPISVAAAFAAHTQLADEVKQGTTPTKHVTKLKLGRPRNPVPIAPDRPAIDGMMEACDINDNDEDDFEEKEEEEQQQREREIQRER